MNIIFGFQRLCRREIIYLCFEYCVCLLWENCNLATKTVWNGQNPLNFIHAKLFYCSTKIILSMKHLSGICYKSKFILFENWFCLSDRRHNMNGQNFYQPKNILPSRTDWNENKLWNFFHFHRHFQKLVDCSLETFLEVLIIFLHFKVLYFNEK